MRIAFISYEHPLGIAGGGIGTYIGQVSNLMATRGHEVEVFSAHYGSDKTINIEGYLLHLVKTVDAASFKNEVLEKFSERQRVKSFDVIESPEYGADALLVKKKFPSLPLAIKLHTPSFLVSELNQSKPNSIQKFRFLLGGVLRGKKVKPYWHYHKNSDLEYQLFKLANSVCSPSNSLKKIIIETWGAKNIQVIPNPFIPSKEILAIEHRNNSKLHVSFIGRLEKRKGVLDLAKAIPIILTSGVDVEFSFVGKSDLSPIEGISMEDYLKKKLNGFKDSISFDGYVSYELIPEILSKTDICVFPSLWENFPTVCLEAMAAGKAVIGTNNGGMSDIIENTKSGILIPPNSPADIAKVIIDLCKDKESIKRIGIQARKKILADYNQRTIGEMAEEFYINTINECKD